MCEICGGLTSHDRRCPYYNSKKNAVYICEQCDEGIHSGEDALVVENKAICSECVYEMDAVELLAFVGHSIRQVELEERMDI